MSIIQTIRERGTVIVIAATAISLIGFILMDSMSGTGKLFGGGDEFTIGSVNGMNIDYNDFNAKVQAAEAQYGGSVSGQRNMISQNVWDQIIAEKVLNDQFKKLGLEFTPTEMAAIMFSNDAPPQLQQAFTDPQTGQYDINQAREWWNQIKSQKNNEQRDVIMNQVVDPMVMNSLYNKYMTMITGSIYQPDWLKKMQDDEATEFAEINYVAIPYSVVSDSTVKISDKEIMDYVNNHKEAFKQEPGVVVSYVAFSAAPSVADSQAVLKAIEDLKTPFEADTNARFFLGRNSSSIPFFDGYVTQDEMEDDHKQDLINLPIGGVYGPYLEDDNYVLAKKLESQSMPDSFKVRHILLGTVNPQTQQPLLPDTTAKRLADSIATAIQHGADFNQLEQEYSTDEAAKQTNGVMTFDLKTVQSENFAREFGDFLLHNGGVTKKVVKTDFGYHYIEIMDKIDIQPAYKFAYMAREIIPSNETINSANTDATTLSASAHTAKEFADYASKNGLAKIDVPQPIGENDYQMGKYADARTAIKWAFDAKEGAVSEPFSIGDDYVVLTVDKKIKKGLADAVSARPNVAPILINLKKSEEIKKKIGDATTLQDVASKFDLEVLHAGEDSTLTFGSFFINGIGNEPKVIGAAFNKDYQKKISPAIPGNTGTFVIKVDKTGKLPQQSEMVQQQQMMMSGQEMRMATQESFAGLRKIAKIKDNRSKFY